MATSTPRPKKPSSDKDGKKLDPPSVLDKDIYATVNKPKRYPPPSVPAPPPPYEGSTIKKLNTSAQNGPSSGGGAPANQRKSPSPSSPTPADDQTHSDKSVTSKQPEGLPGKAQARPPRPAPGRPSRPPAG